MSLRVEVIHSVSEDDLTLSLVTIRINMPSISVRTPDFRMTRSSQTLSISEWNDMTDGVLVGKEKRESSRDFKDDDDVVVVVNGVVCASVTPPFCHRLGVIGAFELHALSP